MKVFLYHLYTDGLYLWLNYIVNNIPSWTIRRLFYKLAGMTIEKGSRIHMKCVVLDPRNIIIGERAVINEYCFLDGRGGLKIGNDASISIYSMLITGTHSKSSETFAYRSGEIIIEDNVWLGARAMVLSPSIIHEKAIISAGSVFKGEAEQNSIYAGNFAIKIGERNLNQKYRQTYSPLFR